jgi:hypothetical protein
MNSGTGSTVPARRRTIRGRAAALGPGPSLASAPAPAGAEEFAAILRGQPGVEVRELEENAWLVAMEGRVRLKINVAVVLRPDRISFYLFMLRAPKENAQEVYRVLLRKNLRTFAMKYALDADGDVWLVAELPRRGFDGEELDRILGVFHQESESAFEPLVHLGFPGVFPPLDLTAKPPVPLNLP